MGKKQTKTGGLSERELKYWLTRNSARGNCWAIYTEIENMTGHENAQVTLPSGISTGRSLGFISRADLKYVYTGYMTNTELIAIVQDRKGYYYLINTKRGPKNVKADSGDAPDAPDTPDAEVDESTSSESQNDTTVDSDTKKGEGEGEGEGEGDVAVSTDVDVAVEDGIEEEENKVAEKKAPVEWVIKSSRIIISKSLVPLIDKNLSKSQRREIGVVKTQKMTLKKEDRQRLGRVLGFDFADCDTPDELLELMRKSLREIAALPTPEERRILDFSGNFSVTPEILVRLKSQETTHIEEIVLYQNIRLAKWGWLARFPCVVNISLWYLYQLKDDNLKTICKALPRLESLNVHHCYQISNRCMIPILQLPRLDRVCMDSKVLICQKNAYQGVVTAKEWENLYCPTLKYLMINSDNLTQDTIDYYLKSCPNLSRFIMNALVLKRLRKDVREGFGPETITFQAAEDYRLGFTVKRDVRIENLLKDRYEPAYSDSMLRIIKEQMTREGIVEFSDSEEEEDPVLNEEDDPVLQEE